MNDLPIDVYTVEVSESNDYQAESFVNIHHNCSSLICLR